MSVDLLAERKFSLKKNSSRRVRFNLPIKSRSSTQILWTKEEFNDRFRRFQCSVSSNYWETLKQRIQMKSHR